MPLAPDKIEKIRALASSSPHDGERAAARAALDRLGLAVERPAARPRDTSTLFGSRPVEEIKAEATFAFANASERKLAIFCARDHGCTAYQTKAIKKSGAKRTGEWKKHIVVRGTRADVLAAERSYEFHRKRIRLLIATFAEGYASTVTGDYASEPPSDKTHRDAWFAGCGAAFDLRDAKEGR